MYFIRERIIQMEKTKNVIVLFPGKRYTVTCPLLYYAHFKYERRGYDCVEINYGIHDTLEELYEFVLEQISKIDFTVYDDIVFLSKSLGTVISGRVEETLSASVRHICLTPIEDTLPYLKKEKNISLVVAGDKDPFLAADTLMMHCNREGIRLEVIEGADHCLEISGDISANIDILKKVVELY